jgi:hypothetical protein
MIRVLLIDTVAGWTLDSREFKDDSNEQAKHLAALWRKTWPDHQVKIVKEDADA